MAKKQGGAVVLGAGMGGLLAARVLSDHFEQVTLIERDVVPALGEQRKGIPQGKHAHGLLAAGCLVLEQMFPRFFEDMVALGAREADILANGHWVLRGRRLVQAASGMRVLMCMRPLLEGYVRSRVLALPGIHLEQGCEAIALLGDAARVQGVRVRARDGRETELGAALIVETTGRGSQLPKWLLALGLDAPEEERIEVDMGYASALYRRTPELLGGHLGAMIAAQPPNPRSGVALAIDDERMIVTLSGRLGDHPIADHAAMREFARTLLAPDLYDLLAKAEPLSAPVAIKMPRSKRIRYERMAAMPAGLIAMGDSLCSFNPVYGQGMTVAAQEAQLLGRLLAGEADLDELPRRFLTAAATIVDAPWTLAAGADLSFPEVRGKRTAFSRFMDRYLERVVHAASIDGEAARRLLRVLQLVDPPSALLSPSLLWRALWRPFGSQPAVRVARLSAAAQGARDLRVKGA